MSATTTIPTVIDALLGVLRGLSACAPPVVVFDGLPGPELPDTFVVIGGRVEPVVASDQEWGGLGGNGQVTYESYDIDGTISVYVGGDANEGVGGANDAQKSARDAAFVILNAFNEALKSDPALAGQNGGQPLVLWCIARHIGLDQTSTADPESHKGRRADVPFKIFVKARLQQ